MPELPEVETVVRALRPDVIGRTITGLHSGWANHLVKMTAGEMREGVLGRGILSIHRRAKYIVFTLSDGQSLLIHLKMTGHLAVVSALTPPDKYAHTIFYFDDGREMRFRDPRKFGKVTLVSDTGTHFQKLGPEPLEDSFTLNLFKSRFANRRKRMKSLLLDQSFVAGIGNIYADEALFMAEIHPLRAADTLSDGETQRLHHAIRHILQTAVDREGTTISDYRKPNGEKGDMQGQLAVFRRTDQPCFTCGTPIRRIIVGQRSTHFCPRCQLAPQ